MPYVEGESRGSNPVEVDQARAGRLRKARKTAGFETAAATAHHFRWSKSTYSSHENGSRNISLDACIRYAGALHVDSDWLAWGRGVQDGRKSRVRIEGYVKEGGLIELRPAEHPDEITDDADTPPGTTADMWRAYRVVGEDNVPFYRHDDILYVPRENGSPDDCIGEICIVQTTEGRLGIRILRANLGGGRYLISDLAQRDKESSLVSAAQIIWTKHAPRNRRQL